jgi:hypothetical protein
MRIVMAMGKVMAPKKPREQIQMMKVITLWIVMAMG